MFVTESRAKGISVACHVLLGLGVPNPASWLRVIDTSIISGLETSGVVDVTFWVDGDPGKEVWVEVPVAKCTDGMWRSHAGHVEFEDRIVANWQFQCIDDVMCLDVDGDLPFPFNKTPLYTIVSRSTAASPDEPQAQIEHCVG